LRKITTRLSSSKSGGDLSESGAIAWSKLASPVRTTDQKQLGVMDAAKQLITDHWAVAGR